MAWLISMCYKSLDQIVDLDKILVASIAAGDNAKLRSRFPSGEKHNLRDAVKHVILHSHLWWYANKYENIVVSTCV
jgi:hypothetical protein